MNLRRGGDQVIPRPDSWRPGVVPAWVDNVTTQTLPSLDVVVERIAQRPPHINDVRGELTQEWVAGARSSAVLVPLFHSAHGLSLIFTKRADHLKNHRGEVSFPGGRVEEAESVRAAALRETHEEIGISPTDVKIIGELDPLTTFVSNSMIVPIVGVVDSIDDLCANENEVSRILIVPIIELLGSDTYHNEWWLTPRGDMNIHFFELEDETIWGATARILRQFIEIAIAPT